MLILEPDLNSPSFPRRNKNGGEFENVVPYYGGLSFLMWLRFFLGRILNRVTRDLSQMDIQLPEILYDTVTISLRLIGTVIIVISANYYILVPTGIACIVFYLARWYYVKTIRDVKRLEAICKHEHGLLSAEFENPARFYLFS